MLTAIKKPPELNCVDGAPLIKKFFLGEERHPPATQKVITSYKLMAYQIKNLRNQRNPCAI
jgi:hypothetical protein